jgi:predicted DNA-binding transcriptional regulator YafY
MSEIACKIFDECVQRKDYPTKQIIMDAIRHNHKSISERTFENIKKRLKVHYRAPLEFCTEKNGYYYTDKNFCLEFYLPDEGLQSLTLASSFLTPLSHIPFVKQYKESIDKILKVMSAHKRLKNHEVFQKVIMPESHSSFTGLELLDEIIEHIANKRVINFTYNYYNGSPSKDFIVHPYLIKEYRNRWYLIGYDEKARMVKTFGLDRMEDMLQDSSKKYNKLHWFDPDLLFKHSIGITNKEGEEPLDIVLSFSPKESNYIKSQPLHDSMVILIDNKEEFRINLKVINSYELKMLILSYGGDVKVLEPVFLREEIKASLEKALSRY